MKPKPEPGKVYKNFSSKEIKIRANYLKKLEKDVFGPRHLEHVERVMNL